MSPMFPAVLTSVQAAAAFAVTDETIKRWAEEGKIPGFKTPGGSWRFRRADIEALTRPKMKSEVS